MVLLIATMPIAGLLGDSVRVLERSCDRGARDRHSGLSRSLGGSIPVQQWAQRFRSQSLLSSTATSRERCPSQWRNYFLPVCGTAPWRLAIHPYRYQHFRRITAPYCHNGREFNLVWCIESNRNTMFSVFEMCHDYNITLALFGGTAPLVVTWMIKTSGNLPPLARFWYLLVVAAVTFVASLRIRPHQENQVSAAIGVGMRSTGH